MSKITMDTIKPYMPHIIIGIIILYLVGKLGNALEGNKESEIKLDEIDRLTDYGSTLTLEQSNLIADNFYNALAGSTLGKDSKLLYSQFEKLKTQNDFNKVYNAFGKRQYSRFWDNVGDPWSSDLLDLLQILSIEISAVEQEFIRSKYPHLTIF